MNCREAKKLNEELIKMDDMELLQQYNILNSLYKSTLAEINKRAKARPKEFPLTGNSDAFIMEVAGF